MRGVMGLFSFVDIVLSFVEIIPVRRERLSQRAFPLEQFRDSSLRTALQGYLAHKKQAPLGPYCRNIPRALGGS
jgi:hypothetical protein